MTEELTGELPHVFAPGAIGSLPLPHRILMGAMHLGSEADPDGARGLAAFYAARARGGAGLMMTGGAAVNAAGAGGARYGVLTDGAFQERLAQVTAAVHDAGGLIGLQLFHAGRYAPAGMGGPVAPSPLISRISGAEPRELTEDEIEETLGDFAAGGELAVALGFDAVEVMGAQGYLIDQFLSPLTNRRDDGWGGDVQGRVRFGVEATRRVRCAVGETFPLLVRLTGNDLMPGGTPAEDVAAFARGLADAGADALDVGVGWHESPVPTVQAQVPAGFWAPVAADVAAAVAPAATRAGDPAGGDAGRRVAVVASNRVNRLEIAEEILASGAADFVSLARPFLADPELVARRRAGRPADLCIGCNQACIDRSLAHEGPHVSCLVRPRSGHEADLPAPVRRKHATGPRRVLVVGGGPAGLHAARDLAAAGCAVTLCEADGALGGQFRLAARVPGKADYGAEVEAVAAQLAELGVDVRLRRPIGPDDLGLLAGFDGVLVATGTRPRRAGIPGADLPHVLSYAEAFAADRAALGERLVVVGGGGIAVDFALYASSPGGSGADAFAAAHGLDDHRRLARAGERAGEPGVPSRAVQVLHRGPRVGARLGRSTRWAVLAELASQQVRVVTGTACERITPDGVVAAGEDGRRLIPADTVVLATGQEPDLAIADLARRSGTWHRVVGAATCPAGADAVEAIRDALDATVEFLARG